MALTDWAKRWLLRLVEDGGAHGPGSKRTVKIGNDDSFSYSFDSAKDLAALRRAGIAGASGRAAVTYEQPYGGGSALWIDAVSFQNGAIVEGVRLVQPYKKRFLGRCAPTGALQDLSRQMGST